MLVALLLSLALVAAAQLLANGIAKARMAERFVTVRGLSEREVDADLALWPISFTVSENDLSALEQRLEASRKAIAQFLTGRGFSVEEFTVSAPQIMDLQSNPYGDARQSRFRYRGQATVLLRSTKVALVKESIERSNELLAQGVVLTADGMGRPEYLFTSLNDIKPAMIEEATKSAREAAAKFAADSQSRVGEIRRATQGLFSINDRDFHSPDRKVVRVVTTVEYFLE